MVAPGPGLDTPRTQADATFITNSALDISMEPSFHSPSKEKNDIVHQLKSNRRGINLKTPRARAPFGDRRNLPSAPNAAEFTPLLKSVTKSNLLRAQGKENGIPPTPAALRAGGLESIAGTPGLPMNSSGIYRDETGASFIMEDANGTPSQLVASSSAMSTPLAMLPKRDAGGVLVDGAQMLTLREQEQRLDKVEKDNFGLKLKIHFLEEALRKSDKDYNEAAIRENTDLKVDKVTMQKELHRYRKSLGAAERDLELYRQQFAEFQEKMKKRHADAGQREELERIQQLLEERDAEIQRLQVELQNGQHGSAEAEKLRDDIGDLEAEIRDKERVVEEQEDQIDGLKEKVEQGATAMAELEERLGELKSQADGVERIKLRAEEQAEALKNSQDDLQDANERIRELEDVNERLTSDAKEAHEDAQEAMQERDRAQTDLDELRDEMSNKSFNTKGLSRQMEEKAVRLQHEFEELKREHQNMQDSHDAKVREVAKFQEKLQDLEQESEANVQKLQGDVELALHEKDIAVRERKSMVAQLEQAKADLVTGIEAKDLLQSRHERMTTELESLQKDLTKAQSTVRQLEEDLEEEKQQALSNDRAIRAETKDEMERLKDDFEDLRQEYDEKERQFDEERDNWDSDRLDLEARYSRATEQITGLERTLEKLQNDGTTPSNKESQLRDALESEQKRYGAEKVVLVRQIEELKEEVDSRRQIITETRAELAQVKEKLRISIREEENFKERVQGLEDEIEVLQSSFDEESEHAKVEISAARQEIDGLRHQLISTKQDLEKAEAASSDARATVAAYEGDIQRGELSSETAGQRVQQLEAQLNEVRKDKQSLQDQHANLNIDMHNLRTSYAELEAQRDEIKSQLKLARHQVDETIRLDQEKLNLRTAKTRLEHDVARLREEKKVALEKSEAIEKELEDEIEKAAAEESRMEVEIEGLRKQLAVVSEGRDRELKAAKRNVKHLEGRVEELEQQAKPTDRSVEGGTELSIIRQNLSEARKKEKDYAQREASLRDSAREMKRKIADLERNLQEAEISKFAPNSPQSSALGSAQKNELVETCRQLAEAHHQTKLLRHELKEASRNLQQKLDAQAREVQSQISVLENEREQFESDIADLRLLLEDQTSKTASAEQTVTRLRTRMQNLERSLSEARMQNGDHTIAEERKDLHDMLKDAKLEVEDLQAQIRDREGTIENHLLAEKDLRAQLQRVRAERSMQTQRANATAKSLETMQRRYERSAQKMSALQASFEAERRALTKGVRFPNMSLSEAHGGEDASMAIRTLESRHQKELKGLATQIGYLRARCVREEGFRADLAYAKRFFLMQIRLYNTCNRADLQMIEEMGITPDRSFHERRPSLRSVVFMVMAAGRISKREKEWRGQVRVKEGLVRCLEGLKKGKIARKSLGY